ncbi:MAG: hypothetical protein R3Y38_06380 [Rikenellaceae bacterium]
MRDWLKKRSTSEKVMLGLIIMLLIGVLSRWEFIKKEGGEAIKNRIELIGK